MKLINLEDFGQQLSLLSNFHRNMRTRYLASRGTMQIKDSEQEKVEELLKEIMQFVCKSISQSLGEEIHLKFTFKVFPYTYQIFEEWQDPDSDTGTDITEFSRGLKINLYDKNMNQLENISQENSKELVKFERFLYGSIADIFNDGKEIEIQINV